MSLEARIMTGAMMMSKVLKINKAAFPEENMSMLAESLGLIPMWVSEFNILGETNLKQFIEERYGYSLYKFEGEVLTDGSYRSKYEDDEDLPFIGKMKTREGDVYMYQYAITAIPTKDGYFITRLD